jgi:hypothetical protein
MTIRVAAIEVSHWHALYDAAYLRHLVAMPDVELVAKAKEFARLTLVAKSLRDSRQCRKLADMYWALALGDILSKPSLLSLRKIFKTNFNEINNVPAPSPAFRMLRRR